MRPILMAGVLCLLCSTRAAAQGWTAPDPANEPWKDAKLNVGPFFMAPSFEVKNVGIDNNVFRDPAFPRQDLTATMAVASIFGAHVKTFSLAVTQDNEYIWYRRYTSERSIDGGLRAIVQLRLAPIRPWITWSKSNSHDRSGYEIDARAGHQTPALEAGSDFNFGMRTGATVSFSQRSLTYSEGEFFDNVDLKAALDNRTTFAHADGHWKYTEFTDLEGGVEYSRMRFVTNSPRDADTISYFGGFTSHGDAAVVGSLTLGYKSQKHSNPGVPDFRGLVASGSLTTIVKDRVRFAFVGDRDINYSYEDQFPFYVQQGTGVTVTLRLSTRFDIIASAKGEWLNYSQVIGDPTAPRTDRATVAGIGFLYTMGGSGSHFGLTFEQADRVSPIPRKNYSNGRVLSNIKFSF